MQYTFNITARDLNPKGAKYPDDAPYASSGQVYDLLAIASGHSELNDLEDMNYDYYAEAVDHARKEYDYERGYIEALNAASDDYPRILALTGNRVSSPGLTRAEEAGLLFGAWYALNVPDMFALGLQEWTDAVQDATRECLGDYSGDMIPADLRKDLEDAYTFATDEQYKEYINGDYRGNWLGVYDEAGKELFNDRDMFAANEDDRRKNLVRVTVPEDEGRTLAEDHDGLVTGKRPGVERVKAAVVATILWKAKAVAEKKKTEREKRATEYAARRQRDEEREKLEANEKRRRLLAMKR